MTEFSGHPGVAAVILFQDRYTDSRSNKLFIYRRIKVLTDEGKKYANVELETVHGDYAEVTIKDIAARTVHPDGQIILFHGKPALQTTEKGKGYKVQSQVFTLPDVTVGSIVEYSYTMEISGVYLDPTWLLQDDLFVKSEHFKWRIDNDTASRGHAAAFLLLPAGVDVQHTKDGAELTATNIAPLPHESFMPPASSMSYREVFYYTLYDTPATFWDKAGSNWSVAKDEFLDGKSKLKQETQQVIAGAKTDDEKLRKIYAAVMALENTNYTRARDRREDKVEGLKQIKTVEGVWAAKRSNQDALDDLFVGMARAAGFKAYDMLVPDRSVNLFSAKLPSFDQFYARIAIVEVDGKERFFDPGAHGCPYGQLAWQHTLVQGLRQTDKASGWQTALAVTPGLAVRDNLVGRVADLKIDETGHVQGVVKVTYRGAAALAWRQTESVGDMEALRHGLQSDMTDDLPKSLEVKLATVDNVDDYEKPLLASFEVTGTLGVMTGKRLVLPADPFESTSSAVFPVETRDSAVYFHYPVWKQDAVRLAFPPSMSFEVVPSEAKFVMGQAGQYDMTITTGEHSILIRRNLVFASAMVPPAAYGDLRHFYQQFESKDQESVILKMTPKVSDSN